MASISENSNKYNLFKEDLEKREKKILGFTTIMALVMSTAVFTMAIVISERNGFIWIPMCAVLPAGILGLVGICKRKWKLIIPYLLCQSIYTSLLSVVFIVFTCKNQGQHLNSYKLHKSTAYYAKTIMPFTFYLMLNMLFCYVLLKSIMLTKKVKGQRRQSKSDSQIQQEKASSSSLEQQVKTLQVQVQYLLDIQNLQQQSIRDTRCNSNSPLNSQQFCNSNQKQGEMNQKQTNQQKEQTVQGQPIQYQNQYQFSQNQLEQQQQQQQQQNQQNQVHSYSVNVDVKNPYPQI